MLKFIITLSVLLFFSCSNEESVLVKQVKSVELVFPDVVVRKFACADKCTMADGNKAFDNSPDKQKILQLISSAKKEIILAQYVYLDSNEVLTQLVNAASRGVDIKIYADSENLATDVPTTITTLLGTDKFRNASIQGRFSLLKGERDYSQLNKLAVLSYVINNSRNSNNFVKFISAPGNANAVFHAKFAIFDSKFLVATTANWSFTGFGYSYEIFAYYDLAKSPSIVNPFLCAAKRLAEDPMTMDTCNTDEVVFSVPQNEGATFDFVNKAFASAKKRVWVAGNQFGTDLFWKVPEAKKSVTINGTSVDFKILTATNVCANHPRLERYENAGITIRCLQVNYCSYQQFHNKYFIVDDSLYFGTLNLDYDGIFNFWDFVIKDNHFLKRLETHFSDLWDKSESYGKTACHGDSSCIKKHCAD